MQWFPDSRYKFINDRTHFIDYFEKRGRIQGISAFQLVEKLKKQKEGRSWDRELGLEDGAEEQIWGKGLRE